MNEILEQYENEPQFQEFLNGEFDRVAVGATMEELAAFAFGSMAEAIAVFEKRTKELK